jgi:hypothetical protein
MDSTVWIISAIGILLALVLTVVESRRYARRHRQPRD